eukprot:1117942-Pleurochrysis_carterae.AAC.2
MRIEPTDIYLWRRKPRRQPIHKQTRARLAARALASCGRAQELACVVSAKETDTRTAYSLTSDRKPSAQGELSGSMPEPSETS